MSRKATMEVSGESESCSKLEWYRELHGYSLDKLRDVKGKEVWDGTGWGDTYT